MRTLPVKSTLAHERLVEAVKADPVAMSLVCDAYAQDVACLSDEVPNACVELESWFEEAKAQG